MTEDRSEDSKYISWAKAVKVRDGFCCVVCGASGDRVYLESHHKNSWDWDINSRYSLDNGVTLCSGGSYNEGSHCHQQFHKIFGYGGNHEYQFEQFKKIYKIFKNLTSSEPKIDASLIVSGENNK